MPIMRSYGRHSKKAIGMHASANYALL